MKCIHEQRNQLRLESRTIRAIGPGLVAIVAVVLALAGPTFADSGRVYPNAESVVPLAVGQMVPAVLVRSIDNQPIELAKLASDSGVLLVFYRGGW